MKLTYGEKLHVESIIADVVDEELGEDLSSADIQTVMDFFVDEHLGAYAIGERLAEYVRQEHQPTKFTRTAEKIYKRIEGNIH